MCDKAKKKTNFNEFKNYGTHNQIISEENVL